MDNKKNKNQLDKLLVLAIAEIIKLADEFLRTLIKELQKAEKPANDKLKHNDSTIGGNDDEKN